MRLSLPIPGMQHLGPLIFIPGMTDTLPEIFRIRQIFGRNIVNIGNLRTAAELLYNAVGTNQKVIEETAFFGIQEGLLREGAKGHYPLTGKACTIKISGFHISRCHRQCIRQMIFRNKAAAKVNSLLNLSQTSRIDRRIAVTKGNRAGHAAHYIVGMRILTAENNMRCHQLALFVKYLQVVADCHEMHLRRQQTVIGMLPPLGGEYTKLTALYYRPQLFLYSAEIIRRCCREILRCIGVRRSHGSTRHLVSLCQG